MKRSKFNGVKTEGGLLPYETLERVHLSDPDLNGTAFSTYHLLNRQEQGEELNRIWVRLLVLWKRFRRELAELPETANSTVLTQERWLLPLFQALGYGRLLKKKAKRLDDRIFIISHKWHHIPIHLVGMHVPLNKRLKISKQEKANHRIRFSLTKKDRHIRVVYDSPYSLLQQFLNIFDEQLPGEKANAQNVWGFLSNGFLFRVMRQYYSLTRQAFVEFDLEDIMENEHFSSFSLFWHLCHQSRVEENQIENEKTPSIWLERWMETAIILGVRSLDKLRIGVKAAIIAFGKGFIRHKANKELRRKLENKELNTQEYYQQLLRLIYRLIFIFVAETRGILLDPNASEEAQERYRLFYDTKRIRHLSNRLQGEQYGDFWRQILLQTNNLYFGEPAIALPALGSFLWSKKACPDLSDVECANFYTLEAFRKLSYLQEEVRYLVNWYHIGSEELGSIYESLLEFQPKLHVENGDFDLIIAAGNARKKSGSYYTPSSLVKLLLENTLDPVLDRAVKASDPEKAILAISICDPACGSGHFLVAAARRIAKRLASLRSGDDQPSKYYLRPALREVIGNCIFGVDLNPMAVELTKVSLWMEALEPGKPLSFLDAHIQVGNSLLGATRKQMKLGIPTDAFKPIGQDCKKVATQLKAKNRKAIKDLAHRQRTFFQSFEQNAENRHALEQDSITIEELDDSDLEAVELKEQTWIDFVHSNVYRNMKFRADAWCATFLWPKGEEAIKTVLQHEKWIVDKDEIYKSTINQEIWRAFEQYITTVGGTTKRLIRILMKQYHFFHWHLAFPHIFREGKNGFDVILSNPPWERIKLQEKEFFALYKPIAAAKNKAARTRLLKTLYEDDSELWHNWTIALRKSEGISHFLRKSSLYPLCGRGDINTYAVFAELSRKIVSSEGAIGMIVPSGIATDATTQYYFRDIIEKELLAYFYDFENRKKLFKDVDSRMRFSLMTLAQDSQDSARATKFAFFLSDTDEVTEERTFRLSASEIALLNPNTKTCPIFRDRRDAMLTKAIYRRVPVLNREENDENPWKISFKRMLDMSNDSNLFQTKEMLSKMKATRVQSHWIKNERRFVPLYEAKMVHHFDHRFGNYADLPEESRSTKLPMVKIKHLIDPHYVTDPRYWVDQREVEKRLLGKWERDWLIGWRSITNATNMRTVISSIIPKTGVGNNFVQLLSLKEGSFSFLVTIFSSFIFDFVVRQKIGGTNLNYFIIRQLPVLSPEVFNQPCLWLSNGATYADFIRPRMLELIYTAWDLEGFAHDVVNEAIESEKRFPGTMQPELRSYIERFKENSILQPFKWSENRRTILRAELDATFFHLYLPADKNGEWIRANRVKNHVHDETNDEFTSLKAHFPTPKAVIEYVMETFPIVKRKDKAYFGGYRTKNLILEKYEQFFGK